MATPSQISLHPPPSPFKLSRPTTCRQDSRRSTGLQPVKAFAKQISFDPTINFHNRLSIVENQESEKVSRQFSMNQSMPMTRNQSIREALGCSNLITRHHSIRETANSDVSCDSPFRRESKTPLTPGSRGTSPKSPKLMKKKKETVIEKLTKLAHSDVGSPDKVNKNLNTDSSHQHDS